MGAETMYPTASTNTFEPSELAFLQRLFKDARASRGIAGDSLDEDDLAARIIELYQQGVRDEQCLHSRLGSGLTSR